MRKLSDLPAVNVRLPKYLWELLRLDAKRNMRSLNTHLIVVLSALYDVSADISGDLESSAEARELAEELTSPPEPV
jgi:hypothetical protein